MTNTQKEKVEKDDTGKIEKKLQFPYAVQAQYEHCTAADTHLQYHCAIRTRVKLPFMCLNCLCHKLKDTNMSQGRDWKDIFIQNKAVLHNLSEHRYRLYWYLSQELKKQQNKTNTSELKKFEISFLIIFMTHHSLYVIKLDVYFPKVVCCKRKKN